MTPTTINKELLAQLVGVSVDELSDGLVEVGVAGLNVLLCFCEDDYEDVPVALYPVLAEIIKNSMSIPTAEYGISSKSVEDFSISFDKDYAFKADLKKRYLDLFMAYSKCPAVSGYSDTTVSSKNKERCC